MTSVILLMSMLMACGESEETVATPNQEAVENKVVKKDPTKEYKALVGLGKANAVSAFLDKSTFSEQQKEEKSFFLAGMIGLQARVDGGLQADSISILSSPLDKTWAAWIGMDYQKMAEEAKGIEDDALKAGFVALSVLNGQESSALSEWKQHQDLKIAEAKKRKKDQVEIPEKDWSAEQALELLVALDPEKGSVFLEQAQSVSSWSAKLALSQWAKKTGQGDLLKFAQQASDFEGPQQAIISLYQASVEPEKATETAKKILETAVSTGDALAGRMAINQLMLSYGETASFQALWSESSEILNTSQRLKMEEGYWESLEGARLAVFTGNLEEGLRLSSQVVRSADGAVLQEGIWFNGLIAAQARDSKSLASLDEKAGEGIKLWLSAFKELVDLREIKSVDSLLTSSISDQQFVDGTLVLSRSCGLCVDKLVPAALQKAQFKADKIRLRLIQAEWTRANGKTRDMQKILDSLRTEFPGANFALELDIRAERLSPDSTSSISFTEKSSEFEKVWGAIATDKKFSTTSKDRALKGLSSVASFVKAADSKSAMDAHVDMVWQNTPYHRVGILSSGTALDGSQGFGHGKYLKKLVGQKEDSIVSAGVGLVEMERTVRMNAEKAFQNRSVLKRYTDGEERKLLFKAAKLRASIVEFWFGGAFPTDDFAALSAEEELLKQSSKSTELYKKTVISGNAIREKFKTTSSVISYLDWDGEYYAAVISPSIAGVKKIGSVSDLKKLTAKHQKALQDGVNKERVEHFVGDDLRSALLLPVLVEELTGVGKYLVVAPTEFLGFSLSSLPEQRDGLRFLADIRKIGVGTSLDAIWSGVLGVTYELDMLAFNRPSGDNKWNDSTTDFGIQGLAINQDYSPEIGLARIHFGEMSKILIGEEATLDNFMKNAEKARYVYLSEIPTSSTGGFEFVGGELSLSQIESMSFQAMTVFLSPEPNQDIQAARVEAFMKAGVQSVIVQSWALPTKEQREYIDNLFISLKRNDPLMIAIEKSRQKTIEAQSKDQKYINNAGIWGAFTAFGKP